MATEVKFLNGELTLTNTGDKAVIAVPYALEDGAPLVSDKFDERDGEVLGALSLGTTLEAGESHTFLTGDGVRFVVEDVAAPSEE